MALFQQHTKQQIDRFLQNPTHGLLLTGPEGAGKAFVARHLAANLLRIPLEKLDNHPYFRAILPEDSSLKIEQIRDLQKFLQLKTPGKDSIRRVVIIENAQLMTGEAQNALLKSLEEPPADTVVILTSPATQKLKETIYSRVQRLDVLPAEKQQAISYFGSDFTEDALNKAHMMSAGHIGLLHALLHDTDHQLAKEITRAKEIIAADKYHRLLRVEELSKQKELLPMFLQACKLICSTALEQAATKNPAQAKRWLHSLTVVYEAEASLPRNPNPKLLMTDLLLNL